ncbi:MAG TPA: type III polyketide synthase [Polyangia bacterium]|nr:type III polyketide synthase [Polyangia bacterium]
MSRLIGVGTAVPAAAYTQPELLALFGFRDRITKRVFAAPHIAKRHLLLPPVDPATGRLAYETQARLNEKFRRGSLELGGAAIRKALARARIAPSELGALVCVTTTGWAVPGLSALLAYELALPADLFRLDLVGMGCNAGLNGLAALDGWIRAGAGRKGLLLCCEINSAIYFAEDSARDGLVNGIFGDGAAALVVAGDAPPAHGPRLVDFAHHLIPEERDAMRFDWDEPAQRWRFFLSRDIPEVLGEAVARPVGRLLSAHGRTTSDVRHWVLHTGGGTVIDAIRRRLGLSEADVRHSRSVLRDFGNVSSGSFLFSFERLLEERTPREGDLGVMITMGPGAQIEAALLTW